MCRGREWPRIAIESETGTGLRWDAGQSNASDNMNKKKTDTRTIWGEALISAYHRNMTDTTWRETINAKGHELLEQIRKIIAEGNVRRIIIRHDHHVIAEFPLTAGVIGVVLAPMLAAVGAIAALVTDCTIEVERDGREPNAKSKE